MTSKPSHPRPLGLSRRALMRTAAAALATPVISQATMAWAQDALKGSGEVVLFSVGGTFTEGLRKAVAGPFTEATGIKVTEVIADFAEPQVRAMHAAGRVDWDIASIQASFYPAMQAENMFLPIDYALWDQDDLAATPESKRLKDAVVLYSSAMLLAYDEREFGEDGPQNWADFWDTGRFPGPRGLYAPAAKQNIEFALMADGVPYDQIWPLTDDKLERAFRKLDEIKPEVTKWWSAGGESPQLLANREYVMTSAFDGRAIAAKKNGVPLRMVWDGAHVNHTYWTVLNGGPNSENAQKFLAFANRARIAAAFTEATGYPGPNANQLQYLPAELAPLLSIAPENASKVVFEDSAWLAEMRPDGKSNLDHIQERWLEWRAR